MILKRGLDAPPQITRRPGGKHFIIRNGGNTRLAILKKLWRETRDSAIGLDFESLFGEVLGTFDDSGDFKFERFQDELIHQMQQPLGKDYNWLKLDILDGHSQQQMAESAAPSPPLQTKSPVIETPKPISEPQVGGDERLASRTKPQSLPDQAPDTPQIRSINRPSTIVPSRTRKWQ